MNTNTARKEPVTDNQAFPLVWFVEDEDAHENAIWAASAWRTDGAGMDLFYRIKQAVVRGRLCYGESSSAELIEDTDNPRVWHSLAAAQNAMQRDHNDAMRVLARAKEAA